MNIQGFYLSSGLHVPPLPTHIVNHKGEKIPTYQLPEAAPLPPTNSRLVDKHINHLKSDVNKSADAAVDLLKQKSWVNLSSDPEIQETSKTPEITGSLTLPAIGSELLLAAEETRNIEHSFSAEDENVVKDLAALRDVKSFVKKQPGRKRTKVRNNAKRIHECASCGINKTPLWRKGPLGKGTLCNSCGLQWSLKGVVKGKK